jgi:hypothetical protein
MAIRFIGTFRPNGMIKISPLFIPPQFLTQPTITPQGGAMGTVFTGNDGEIRAATITKREWFLNDKLINGATTNTYTSDGTGSLTYKVTAVGKDTTITAISSPVTITPSQVVQHAPTWRTRPGLLGTFAEGSSVSIPLEADDVENNISTYTITGGMLPNGVSLNTFSGLISGELAEVDKDTSYSFEITVTDRTQLVLKGTFTINVSNVKTTVTWNTPNDQPVSNAAPGEPVNIYMGAQSS